MFLPPPTPMFLPPPTPMFLPPPTPMFLPPPTPILWGVTTPLQNRVAMAASAAEPPFRRKSLKFHKNYISFKSVRKFVLVWTDFLSCCGRILSEKPLYLPMFEQATLSLTTAPLLTRTSSAELSTLGTEPWEVSSLPPGSLVASQMTTM